MVLGGETDTGGVSLAAAVHADSGLNAGDLIKDAAKAVQGGGGGKGDVAVGRRQEPRRARRGARHRRASRRGRRSDSA